MTNSVTTICTITGLTSALRELRSLMFSTEWKFGRNTPTFEFKNIIPMPVSVAVVTEAGGVEEIITVLLGGAGCVQAWQNLQLHRPQIGPWKGIMGFGKGEMEGLIEAAYPGLLGIARQKCLAFGETGYWGWFDWATANWGTEWTASNVEIRSEAPFTFKFETARRFPEPVFKALAARFPELKFRCTAFHEGWSFAGDGFFNPHGDGPSWRTVEATAELHAEVYGRTTAAA